MTRHFARLLALLVALLACAHVARAEPPPAAPPRYSVVRDESGVWWFQGPDGRRFYSLGICNISPEPFRPRPGTKFYNPVPTEFGADLSKWAAHVRSLLLDHGFNTLGAWSHAAIPTDDRLHTTPVLYVVQHEGTRCLSPLRDDFETFVRENVREAIAKLPPRQHILGVFLDNEMPWYGKSGWDDLPTYTLLEQAFELPPKDERRVKALGFLQSRHASADAFAKAWTLDLKSWDDLTAELLRSRNTSETLRDRDAFTKLLADRFYEFTTRVVREALPGTLILGTRIPGNAPDAVIQACGRHCDVMSVNEYRTEPKASEATLTRFWILGGKPIMHTEFSWRARQNSSGNPNTRGAGAVVDSQSDRARAYSSLLADIATVPYVIGSHWFEFADQSPQGRFDGEDSNYGVVDIHNKPYTELLEAMRAVNARVHDLHKSTTRVMPAQLPKPQTVTYIPGQHPGRAPTIDLLADWIREPEIWGAPDTSLSWKRDGAALVLTYHAGSQYGCGINIFGPKSAALAKGPPNACDLDGYSTFVLEADAPRNVQLNLVLAEAGAGPSSQATFDLSAGDDAEAFISAAFTGAGERHTYRIPIERLVKQKFHGSQAGAARIDMQALRNTGLQISGLPESGIVRVYRFALER